MKIVDIDGILDDSRREFMNIVLHKIKREDYYTSELDDLRFIIKVSKSHIESLDDKKSAVPEGDEDLYMLKSQMVPPVCPACPEVKACPREKPCPPCPPCARCPEPSFECKKVPNYSSKRNDSLPRPVLADFSQFGM